MRARCPKCLVRFPWPEGEPTTALEPFIRPEVACPGCHRIVPLTEEPLDERWWAWAQAAAAEEVMA